MVVFEVPDMACGHCVGAITRSVQDADPEATVTADVAEKLARVESSLSADALVACIAAAGYTARPLGI